MQQQFTRVTPCATALGLLSRLLSRLVVVLMLGLLSGCSVMAALSYYNNDEDGELADALTGQASQSAAFEDDEYQIGEMVLAVSAAIQAPERSESIDTVARYGTDSRYYVMIRGWLNQELRGVQSQLGVTQDRSAKIVLQQKSDFLQASIRRIDLE